MEDKELPTIPTDSIYKVMTFIGFMLLAFCGYTVNTNSGKSDLAVLDATNAVTNSDRDVQSALVEIISAGKALADPKADDVLKRVAVKQVDEVSAEYEQLKKDNDKAYNDLSHANEEKKQAQNQNRYLVYGIYLGGFVGALGFLLWYLRGQKPQDKAALTPPPSGTP